MAETSRLLSFVARGIGDPDRLPLEYEARCHELANAKDELSLEPEQLTPAALSGYRADLSHVASIIGSGNPESMQNCAEILRRIIKTVTVGETSSGQIEISITGHLRALIDAPHLSRKAVGGAMVAEERLKSCHHHNPTFVLRKIA